MTKILFNTAGKIDFYWLWGKICNPCFTCKLMFSHNFKQFSYSNKVKFYLYNKVKNVLSIQHLIETWSTKGFRELKAVIWRLLQMQELPLLSINCVGNTLQVPKCGTCKWLVWTLPISQWVFLACVQHDLQSLRWTSLLLLVGGKLKVQLNAVCLSRGINPESSWNAMKTVLQPGITLRLRSLWCLLWLSSCYSQEQVTDGHLQFPKCSGQLMLSQWRSLVWS